MASGTATGDDRLTSTIRRDGAPSLANATIRRFFDADGTSHMRALAYESILVTLSGFIGLIGLASVLGIPEIRLAVQQMVSTLSPGPSGRLLQQAAKHGAAGGGTAAIVGLAAALAAGTLAMAQLERSANRLAGVDDRPLVRRYVTAFLLALSGGLLLVVGGVIIAGSEAVTSALGWTNTASTVWSVVRWPLGAPVVGAAVWLLFRTAPRRPVRPRRAAWAGAGVAVVLWIAFTGGLALYLSIGGGRTYGSLITIVALLLWSVLTSLAMHLGLAVAYELESRIEPGSVRAAADTVSAAQR